MLDIVILFYHSTLVLLKFLGVYVDENFTWKSHISFVCKQISKSCGIIFRSRYCLSSYTTD